MEEPAQKKPRIGKIEAVLWKCPGSQGTIGVEELLISAYGPYITIYTIVTPLPPPPKKKKKRCIYYIYICIYIYTNTKNLFYSSKARVSPSVQIVSGVSVDELRFLESPANCITSRSLHTQVHMSKNSSTYRKPMGPSPIKREFKERLYYACVAPVSKLGYLFGSHIDYDANHDKRTQIEDHPYAAASLAIEQNQRFQVHQAYDMGSSLNLGPFGGSLP